MIGKDSVFQWMPRALFRPSTSFVPAPLVDKYERSTFCFQTCCLNTMIILFQMTLDDFLTLEKKVHGNYCVDKFLCNSKQKKPIQTHFLSSIFHCSSTGHARQLESSIFFFFNVQAMFTNGEEGIRRLRFSYSFEQNNLFFQQ